MNTSRYLPRSTPLTSILRPSYQLTRHASPPYHIPPFHHPLIQYVRLTTTNTATMRAQVLEKFNTPYTLKDLPKPPAPEGPDLLIRVLAASYCHTDAVFASGAMQQILPRIGSHEFAGEILSMGPSVPSSLNLSVGTAVGVPGRAYHCCGECEECTDNEPDPKGYGVWCSKAGNLGLSRDGGFQDYCIVDSRQVAPIPSGMTAVDTAPLMCAGITIWRALSRGGVELREGGGAGKKIAISGAGGGLGHLGVQFAARMGAHVLAIDAGDKPLSLLKDVVSNLGEAGSNVTIVDARTQDPEAVRASVGGPTPTALDGEKGCDAVLILPEAQRALEYGMKLLRNHGTCVVVSFPKDGFRILPGDLVFRDIKMVGTLTGRVSQMRDMLAFAGKYGVRAKTNTYKLEDLNGLVEDYHKGAGGKLVVDMLK